MEIRCASWAEAGGDARPAWSALREGNPALRSPYFAWSFIDIVARHRGGVEVSVFEEGSRPAGYLPFQRAAPRAAEPVGTPLSDYHGTIAGPGLRFDPRRWLEACELDSFAFDHLVVDQPGWEPFVEARPRSPYVDLSTGLDAWMGERRRNGRSAFDRLGELGRALVRAHGPLRFERDSRDPVLLERLLALKSDQYRRTLGDGRDLFARPEMVAIVNEIHGCREPELCGVLSVLWAGDTLAAAHFGMRSADLLHWWFPVYAPALKRYSPGALLLLEIVRAAPAAGIRLIDFGKGAEAYKLRLANGAFEVAEGRVTR